MQTSFVSPIEVEYLPGMHLLQLNEFELIWKVPALHEIHPEAAPYFPGGQLRQLAEPASLVNLPISHARQAFPSTLLGLYLPAEQGVQFGFAMDS